MKASFKGLGAMGLALLVLNEIRGLVMVASVAAGFADGALAFPRTADQARAVAACALNPWACRESD